MRAPLPPVSHDLEDRQSSGVPLSDPIPATQILSTVINCHPPSLFVLKDRVPRNSSIFTTFVSTFYYCLIRHKNSALIAGVGHEEAVDGQRGLEVSVDVHVFSRVFPRSRCSALSAVCMRAGVFAEVLAEVFAEVLAVWCGVWGLLWGRLGGVCWVGWGMLGCVWCVVGWLSCCRVRG